MKTINEIKDELSQKHGYDSFIDMQEYAKVCRLEQWNHVITTPVPKGLEYQHLLLYVKNLLNPDWDGMKLGTYGNNRFYADGGLSINEHLVTHWMPITSPSKPEL